MLDVDGLNKEDKIALAASAHIDMNEKAKDIEISVGSIVLATGWKPYDMHKLENLGQGEVPNCISNMQLERSAAPNGYSNGFIVRPSDGKTPKNIAFVQCAGSRDQNHLNYCSYICCMASLKQASYVLEQYPGAQVTIYYIDIRTPGRYTNFRDKVMSHPNVTLVKGKVAEITSDAATGDVLVGVEDAVKGVKRTIRHDLVVLATGMQPSLLGENTPFANLLDEDGFVVKGGDAGIFAAGCSKQPLDVTRSAQSGTSAALQAIQTVRGR